MLRPKAGDEPPRSGGQATRRSHERQAGSYGPVQWQVEIHHEITSLAAAWADLEARGACTVFQSLDWLMVWYEVTERHAVAEPLIVVARRVGAPGPEVILPMCRTRRHGYVEIGFADIMVSDFVAPVFDPKAFAAPGAMRALWQRVLDELPPSDVVNLHKIAPQVGSFPNPLLDLPDLVECRYGVWGIPIVALTEQELQESTRRTLLGRTIKRRIRMAKEHEREADWHDDPAELARLFQRLVSMRSDRFASLKRKELLHDPVWREFYEILVARRHSRLKPVIASLSADGQVIALTLGFGYQDAFHYIMPTFKGGEWNRHAPGLQLSVDLMTWGKARGYTYFDFTIGDEPYKKELGAERRPLRQAFIARTLKGHIARQVWRLGRELRNHPQILFLAKRILGRPTGHSE